MAGGINAAREGSFWSISNELLARENPDIIFVPEEAASLKSSDILPALTGKVVAIDGDMAERQGIRSADAVAIIAESLYPEYFR